MYWAEDSEVKPAQMLSVSMVKRMSLFMATPSQTETDITSCKCRAKEFSTRCEPHYFAQAQNVRGSRLRKLLLILLPGGRFVLPVGLVPITMALFLQGDAVMAGLSGHSTQGVGQDIIRFLTEIARFFDVTLHVTSGLRSADGQAHAMLDNWIKLHRGGVYKLTTLSLGDREKLNTYYKTAREDGKATLAAKKAAETNFLRLAQETVGSKSKHVTGRAIDLSQASVSSRVYRAITLCMHEVKEGRKDIYHFESVNSIPPLDPHLQQRLNVIKNESGSHPLQNGLAPYPVADTMCVC
jgi:hypothetical protein